MQLRRVNLGDIVSLEDVDYFVDMTGDKGTRLAPVLGGMPVWVDLTSISTDPTFVHHGPGDQRGNTAIERIELAMLATDVRDDVLFWLGNINEARYGVTNPSDPDAVPREGYGPDTTVNDRFTLKAQELTVAGIKITSRNLFRKDAAYRDQGLTGLIDRRKIKASKGATVDGKIKDAAEKVIAKNIGGTTRPVKYFIEKVKQQARKDNPNAAIAWPSDSTMRRYLTPLLDAAGLTGTASSRRSASNRPDRCFQPVLAMYPGQYVGIDTNYLDVEVVMPDGKVIRPQMTLAIDVFTRTIVGFHVHAGSPTSVDHAVLLGRIMRPRGQVAWLDENTQLSGSRALPTAEMVAMGQASPDSPANPYIAIETLVQDQGKDFMGLIARAAAQKFGISVITAPPHSPTYKNQVERFFKTVNTQLLAYSDAYISHSPDHRGRNDRVPIPFAQVHPMIAKFIITVYQNRPHEGLILRDFPGRVFTPNQMYSATFDASAGIPIPITEDDYISLMPHDTRVLQSDGIHIFSTTYDSPDLNKLRTRPGKVEVRWDPYDTDRVWVLHPETGAWVECAARGVRLAAIPFGKSTAANLAATKQASDPYAEFVQNFLDAEDERLDRAKSDARKAAREAKKAAAHGAASKPEPAPDSKAAARASRKGTKASAEKAQRASDDMPRPGPAKAAPLPPVTQIPSHPGDYTVA